MKTLCRHSLKLALWGVIFYFSLHSGLSYSEEARRGSPYVPGNSDLKVDLGLSTWISEGRTKWNHDASGINPEAGNPTSELDYDDVRSIVAEVNGRLTTDQGFFVRGSFGYGGIDKGTLIDDDFFSALGAANHTMISGPHRWSRTESDIDGGHLWYVNVDFGTTLFTFLERKGSVQAFAGYQHWREKYVAKGLRQIECTTLTGPISCSAPGTVSFTGREVITNTVEWDSLRVGLDSEFQFFKWFGIQGSAAFVPLAVLSNEDIHHLRTDLRQDPSFSMNGTGHGYNLEGGLRLMVKGLSVTAGYRYWSLIVRDGELRDHPVFPPFVSSTATLNEFDTKRHGATFGVSYSF